MEDWQAKNHYRQLIRKLHDIETRHRDLTQYTNKMYEQDKKRVQDEIASLPEHVVEAERRKEVEDGYTLAVERYLVRRAERLMPQPDDVWEDVRSLTEDHPVQAAADLTTKLEALRELQLEADTLRAMTEAAAKLPHYSQETSADVDLNVPTMATYRSRLRTDVRDYLSAVDSPPEDIVAEVSRWFDENIDEIRARFDEIERTKLIANLRKDHTLLRERIKQEIMSGISILRLLGLPDRKIENTVRSAAENWHRRNS